MAESTENNGSTGLADALEFWQGNQLRILVVASLAIQWFLFVFAPLRQRRIPGLLRLFIWLAYLGSDAVAIYALATLFNSHRCDDTGSSSHAAAGVELLWAPIMLVHLGGQDSITAYNIEDNELWRRHVVTAVSQVAVAIYVFVKTWPKSIVSTTRVDQAAVDRVRAIMAHNEEMKAYGRIFTPALLLFFCGITKCVCKPWDLKRVSVNSLVDSSSSSGGSQGEDSEISSLQEYVGAATQHFEASKSHASGDGDGEACKVEEIWKPYNLCVDLAPPYSGRLSCLKHLASCGPDAAHRLVKSSLSATFHQLYTKESLKLHDISHFFTNDDAVLTRWKLLTSARGIRTIAAARRRHAAGGDRGVPLRRRRRGRDARHHHHVCAAVVGCPDGVRPADGDPPHVRPDRAAGHRPPDVAGPGGAIQPHRVHGPLQEALVALEGGGVAGVQGHGRPALDDEALQGRLVERDHRTRPRPRRRRVDGGSHRRRGLVPRVQRLPGPVDAQPHGGRRRRHRGTDDERVAAVRRERPRLAPRHRLLLPPPPRPGWQHIPVRHCHGRASSLQGDVQLHGVPPLREAGDANARRPAQSVQGRVRRARGPARRGPSSSSSRGAGTAGQERPRAHKVAQLLKSSDNGGGGGSVVCQAWSVAEELMDSHDGGGASEEKMWGVVQSVWVEMLCFSASRCKGYLHAKSLGTGGEYLSYVWLLLLYMGMETLAEKMQRTELYDGTIPKSAAVASSISGHNV